MKPRPWDQSHPSNWFQDTPENHISALEQRVTILETVIRQHFGEDALKPRVPAKPKRRKPGPAPEISDEHLFYRRESIIDFFEFYWPELRIVFAKKNRQEIRRLLDNLSQPDKGSYASTAAKMLDNLDQLLEFLCSREWNGDPRLAASAMTNVPENRWTTSLRRCRTIPTARAIGVRALRDYLHRNFSRVFRALLRAKTAEDVREAMGRIRTDDRELNWLRDNPEDVFEVLRLGQPGQLR